MLRWGWRQGGTGFVADKDECDYRPIHYPRDTWGSSRGDRGRGDELPVSMQVEDAPSLINLCSSCEAID